MTEDTDATTISITGSATVVEGATGAYTVTLTNQAQTTAVTVNLTYSGTAANGSDFTGVATVTIPAGSTSANFNIATINDVLAEGSENFTITIASATGGNFEAVVISGTNGSVTTNIPANDNPPTAIGTSNVANEDVASVAVVIEGTDVDGTIASFTLSTLPVNGALYTDAALTILAAAGTTYAATGNARTFYFKPAADWNGTTNFNFIATDNQGLVSTAATETIVITPVSDGPPIAVNESFQTLVGTSINFTRAQLLSNDTLTDFATLTATGPLPAGLTYNAGTETYTYNPGAAGSGSFTYTLTDQDGQTSTATVSLQAFNSRDDLASVNESALSFGTGGGSRVATGNLYTNDAGLSNGITNVTAGPNTTILSNSITGTTRTVITTYGTLVIDQSTLTNPNGTYTYTLNSKVDNDSQTGADTTKFTETFNYVRTGGNANLIVNIQDDRPIVESSVTEVALTPAPTFNLFFMLDVSGSMTVANSGGGQRLVDANGNATIVDSSGAGTLGGAHGTSTLAQMRDAVKALVSQYFDEATNVSVEFGVFSAGAQFNNVAYTTKASALAAIDALTNLAAGTNYSAGLTALQQMVGTVANPNDGVQRISYFITDGQPSATSGQINGAGATINSDVTDPGASSGYQTFANNSKIQTYAVAIGAAVPNTVPLVNIHNVDADASDIESGAVNNGRDAPLIVTDLNKLTQSLSSTVPPSVGGNIGGFGSSAVRLGADGGYTQTLTLLLDTNDPDTVMDTSVTFTFNGTNQITNNNNAVGGATFTGNTLTLDLSRGFTKGILQFNFLTGDYTYFPQGSAAQGDEIVLNFSVIDNDGDTASGTNTIKVIDGKPMAVNDFDTLLPSTGAANTKFFEGNVINAVGTDGGGAQLSGFKSGLSGEDLIVDGADVSSIIFKGTTYNLTAASSGTANGGNFTVNAQGELTWTSTTEAANVLVFHRDGYYKYTPAAAQTGTPPQAGLTTVNLTSVANVLAGGLTLQGYTRTDNLNNTPTGTVVYSGNGAAVDGVGAGDNAARLDNLENLAIVFNRTNYAQGVQNVTINLNAANSDLGTNGGIVATVQYSVYDIAGNLMGQFATNSETPYLIQLGLSGIGRIEIQPNSSNNVVVGSVTVQSVSFNAINNAATANIPDEVIQYTITDKDTLTSPDSSTASLTLHVVTNQQVGTAGIDTLNGTASNDLISGLDGNDVINGNAGSDVIRGGAGLDVIDGGADDDQIFGGDGNDNLTGGTGNDLIYGDAGDDTINAGDGNDKLYGGAGADTINGGIGSDTIFGGAGSDTLTGDAGVDIFKWELADKGPVGTPAQDIITDFNPAAVGAGGDVLDLRDLLVGENQAGGVGNLASFIHFEKVGADTIIHINNTGAFNAGFQASKDVQVITLQNVDLVTGFANDQDIIQQLLTQQKLITD